MIPNKDIANIKVGEDVKYSFESLPYRGMIFGYLRKNFNFVVAVLIQSLVFGVLHLNLVQSIYTFILGIILSRIYIYI